MIADSNCTTRILRVFITSDCCLFVRTLLSGRVIRCANAVVGLTEFYHRGHRGKQNLGPAQRLLLTLPLDAPGFFTTEAAVSGWALPASSARPALISATLTTNSSFMVTRSNICCNVLSSSFDSSNPLSLNSARRFPTVFVFLL